jgi:predicted nucleotidyltransferase
MKACGIIAEYNPFHNGHAYLLKAARAQSGADALVVVMSGNYVQRGEPAIVDKWHRARTALQHGADLVIELPFIVAGQPADRFAAGALQLLEALGCETLAFGVEKTANDFQTLLAKISSDLVLPQFEVDYTKTYATQWNDFIEAQIGHRIEQPNQLLALSYALANRELKSPLKMLPIERIGVAHDAVQSSDQFASASTIRRLLLSNQLDQAQRFVPYGLNELGQRWMSWSDFWPYLHYFLNVSSPDCLSSIYQMSEGLEYRFWEQNLQSTSFDDFLKRVKSKRYTYSRLRRLALYTLLQTTATEMKLDSAALQPVRVLGFSSIGQAYLHDVRKTIAPQLITRVTAELGKRDGVLGTQVRVDRLIEQVTGVEQNFHQRVLMMT